MITFNDTSWPKGASQLPLGRPYRVTFPMGGGEHWFAAGEIALHEGGYTGPNTDVEGPRG
jgi:hypothetical protein